MSFIFSLLNIKI